jgi:hypothetical protein
LRPAPTAPGWKDMTEAGMPPTRVVVVDAIMTSPLFLPKRFHWTLEEREPMGAAGRFCRPGIGDARGDGGTR